MQNRRRILLAARSVVAKAGSEATMDEIAAWAGVAVGTLYRHFPSKEDLVAAVIADSIEQIASLAEHSMAAVVGGAPAGPEFASLFRVVVARQATDRTVKAAAGQLDETAEILSAPPDSPAGRATTAIVALLDQAKAAGAVRRDVGLADLIMLVGAAPGPEAPPAMRDRYVDFMVAGLTPRD